MPITGRALRVVVFACVCALAASGPAGAEPEPQRSRTFAEVIGQKFKEWDKSRDGVLSPAEADALIASPAVRGEEAAALAAIRNVVRSTTFDIQRIDMPYLKQALGAHQEAASKAGKRIEDVTLPRWPNFERAYQIALARIAAASKELWVGGKPALELIRAGEFGDYYFVAMAGWMAAFKPERLMEILTTLPNGKFKVDFGPRQVIEVTPLTEGEIARASTSGAEGQWMALLEKGRYALYVQQFPQQNKENVPDQPGRNAKLENAIRLLSGHDSMTQSLRVTNPSTRRDRPAGEVGNMPDRTVLEQLRNPFANRMMVGALTADVGGPPYQMMGSSIYPSTPLPEGMPPFHPYAVLSAGLDGVVVWDPSGRDFDPAPGSQHIMPDLWKPGGVGPAHAMRGGIIKLPLSEFARIFHSMEIEMVATANAPGEQRVTPKSPAAPVSPTPPANRGK